MEVPFTETRITSMEIGESFQSPQLVGMGPVFPQLIEQPGKFHWSLLDLRGRQGPPAATRREKFLFSYQHIGKAYAKTAEKATVHPLSSEAVLSVRPQLL